MSFFADYQREIKRQDARGRCLHFADHSRCNEIVAAHSIQKRGQLGLIAEDGHIYRLSADHSVLKESGGAPRPKKVGVNRASTFAGFCKQHDNRLFAPIDTQPLVPNQQQAALYAYRSICREYFVKENAVAVLGKMASHDELDPTQQRFLAASLTGHRIGLEGLRFHKSIYDQALTNARFHEFHFTCFTALSRCSLQVSGLLYPDRDFQANELQDLGNWHSPLDLITFFTAPHPGGWAFGFAWHDSSSRTCIPLLRSLANSCTGGLGLEDALFRFAVSCCENHAMRVSWWDNLPAERKQAALERMELMTHPTTPVPANYLATGCEGVADWKFEYVYSTLSADA